MTTAEFRQAIAALGLTQAGLARAIRDLGDTAPPRTVLRRVEAWGSGRSRVPGEVAALLTVFRCYPILDELPRLEKADGRDCERI